MAHKGSPALAGTTSQGSRAVRSRSLLGILTLLFTTVVASLLPALVQVTPAYATGPDLTLTWESTDSGNTSSIAWGDYDNNGTLDLAASNWLAASVVYPNTNGTIATSAAWSSPLTSDRSQGIAWGDYDNDNDLDLVVVNACSPSCTVNRLYRNNGGSLSEVWTFGGNDSSRAVAWGDYDNDGDLDLAVANNTNPNRLYRNNDGTFSEVWSFGTDDSTWSVAWGDYDNDDDPDLAVGNNGQANRIYRNDSTPDSTSFVLAWSASNTTDNTYSVAWGDVDNDGYIDLAVGNNNGPNRLYRNVSGSVDMSPFWSSSDTHNTWSVVWGDYDNDGYPDLAAANDGQADVIYRNNGANLEINAVWTTSDTPRTQSMAWGDYDNDGDLDLAASNANDKNRVYSNPIASTTPNIAPEPPTGLVAIQDDTSVTLQWNAASDDFTPAAGLSYNVRVGTTPGGSDVLAPQARSSGLRLLPEPGNAQQNKERTLHGLEPGQTYYWSVQAIDTGWKGSAFSSEGSFSVLLTSGWASNEDDNSRAVAWGDYDGDGDLDLAIANEGTKNQLYRNDNGVLTTIAIRETAESDDSNAVAWGDYDGDGDLDLAVGNNGPNRLYRNDNGTLKTEAVWMSSDSDDSRSVAWGDYDNDGDLDLAVGNNGPNRIYANVNGVLDTEASWSSESSEESTSVAWGDYDGDGDLDLAVGNRSAPGALYRNNGGSLTVSSVWSSEDNKDATSVAWGDYDGDGDLDLAVGNDAFDPNYVYRTNAGTLSVRAVWTSDDKEDTTGIAWGDVDNDGDLDLAASAYFFGPSRVYRNQSSTLTDASVWNTPNHTDTPGNKANATGLAWGDVDDDGDLDLATSNSFEQNRVYINPIASTNANTSPTVPGNLSHTLDGTSVTLQWEAASDGQTPADGLSYNLRVGTTPGGDNVMPAQARSSGQRLLPALGNVQQNTTWVLQLKPGQTYYWSVQAIDASWSGSAFAPEQSFETAGVPVNEPPAFISIPQTEAQAGEPYTYTVEASDPDDAALTITAPTLPDWLTLQTTGDTTALLSGTPASDASGEYPVSLRVSDSEDASRTQTFTITVSSDTPPPPPPPTSPCDEIDEVPRQECEALVALYESTNGDGWFDNEDWLSTSVSPCRWYGIGCGLADSNGKQHITTMRLGDNVLSGTLPLELGNLTHLVDLRLDINNLNSRKLTGPLPLSLSNLQELEKFYYDQTDLCEPADTDFQQWLARIRDAHRSDTVCQPPLTINKSVSATIAERGETLEFTLTVTATDTRATITLTDSIPIGLDWRGLTEVPDSIPGPRFSEEGVGAEARQRVFYSGTVEPDKPVTIRYQVEVENFVEPGSILDGPLRVATSSTLLEDSATVTVVDNRTLNTLMLIYYAADNDLQDDGVALLNSAEKAAGNPNVTILMMLDGPGEDDAYLYRLEQDDRDNCPNYTNPDCDNRYVLGQTMWQWNDNVADPAVLADFISGALTAYPNADQVMLALVGHGSGISAQGLTAQPGSRGRHRFDPLAGLLQDNNPAGTSLSTRELADGLRWGLEAARVSGVLQESDKIDGLYLDACLMSMSEVGYEIRESVGYMLASANLKWAVSDYASHIEDIDGTRRADELLRQWMNNEADILASQGEIYPYTYAVTNLDHIASVRSALDNLVTVISPTLRSDKASIQAAITAANLYDSNGNLNIQLQEDSYVDLASFARLLREELQKRSRLNQDVNEAINALQAAIDVAVDVDGERHLNGRAVGAPGRWEWSSQIQGLSIYLPLSIASSDIWKLRYYTDRHFSFAEDGLWDEFLNAYWAGTDIPEPQSCSEDNEACEPETRRPVTIIPGTLEQQVYLPLVIR